MRKYLFFLTLISSLTLQAQKPLVWQVLSMTTYSNHPSGDGRQIPNFPSLLIDKYEGEEVSISGYLIPMDVAANTYALSKNPFASCFFCGGAGPETVIELRFDRDPGRFATDRYVIIKGKLQLNRDGYGMFFTLLNADLHA